MEGGAELLSKTFVGEGRRTRASTFAEFVKRGAIAAVDHAFKRGSRQLRMGERHPP